MRLDVVVPTYNRSQLLRRTIASLQKAVVPPGLEVGILIVDNNSSDDTAAVVEEMRQTAKIPTSYFRERKQGLSHARNAGIAACKGDLVAFIDDDEEVAETWYEVVQREFQDGATEFIGGPYLANWAAPAPSWLPLGYHAVIGVVDPKPRAIMDAAFSGNLMGGNAVIRRGVFDRVGTYSGKLGRSGKGLLSEEDAEFYRRLLAAGVRGFHAPDLIIYHYIPVERLTRSYHRRWCYWRGVSQGVLDRDLREPVPYTFGLPRYRIGRALQGLVAWVKYSVRQLNAAKAFAAELTLWDLGGFIHGKHFARIERYYEKETRTQSAS